MHDEAATAGRMIPRGASRVPSQAATYRILPLGQPATGAISRRAAHEGVAAFVERGGGVRERELVDLTLDRVMGLCPE